MLNIRLVRSLMIVHCIVWQNSDVYIKVVEGGVPDYLLCGDELKTKKEQKKHFEIRLFISFGFGFQVP